MVGQSFPLLYNNAIGPWLVLRVWDRSGNDERTASVVQTFNLLIPIVFPNFHQQQLPFGKCIIVRRHELINVLTALPQWDTCQECASIVVHVCTRGVKLALIRRNLNPIFTIFLQSTNSFDKYVAHLYSYIVLLYMKSGMFSLTCYYITQLFPYSYSQFKRISPPWLRNCFILQIVLNNQVIFVITTHFVFYNIRGNWEI